MTASATRTIRTTCPRDCYDSCGVVVETRAGRIVRVKGDPDHPVSRGALCAKCTLAYNGVWRDPAARLTRPLRRAGVKGAGRFEAIGWDQALAEIAERLRGIVAAHGAGTVLHAHYTGTCSLLAGAFPLRFFRRLGAVEVEPDTICNNAGHAALDYLYGTSTVGFDPRTAKDAAAIFVWGCNPSASAPHAHKHWLAEAPGQVVVVDPVRHATAAAADLHLQPFPGSDAALAFAMMRVLVGDGLVDRAFLAAHAVGWEELEPRLEPCTLEWAEEKTGVPAADIVAAARLYAAGPTLLWLGQGLQRQPRGGNAFRVVASLAAVTGNLGKKGAGFYFLNGKTARGIDLPYVAGAGMSQRPPPPVSHMALAGRLADTEAARAFFCWNMNVAASAPRQGELRAALAREDLFTVVVELFPTDTADFADIVLPAAGFLEFDDLIASYFHYSLSAQAQACEPPGEALPNQEIFRRLAGAMGYGEPELHESDGAVIGQVLARSDAGLSFEELKARGTVDLPATPVVQFAELAFPTPSGRIEIASDRAAADGHPLVPEPHADPRPAAGRFRLLSPASAWLLNSSYANDAKLAARMGPATVAMNRVDAAELGVADGDMVELANASGRLRLEARLGDAVAPGVLLAHKSRWPKLEGGANVNALNPGVPSDMGESSTVHGVEVTIGREDNFHD